MRRDQVQRVEDLVNLDLVRSVLKQVYHRRRFLDEQRERGVTLQPESRGGSRLEHRLWLPH